MIRLLVLLGIAAVLLARRKPAPNSGHWIEPYEVQWDVGLQWRIDGDGTLVAP